MKILIAGDWHSEVHEETVFQAFRQLGHEPLRFAWHEYFEPRDALGKIGLLLLKAQNKYMFGPRVDQLNHDLVGQVTAERPELLFAYGGSHVYPDTLRLIRRVCPQTILISYNNDDPFSPLYPKWKWRHFLAGVPEYDLVLAYRLHNLVEFRTAGANRVELLRSWFVPERNRPVDLTEEDRKRYQCDVVFVGHYEDDERVEYLRAVVRAGYKLRIWGPGYDWDPAIKHIPELKDQVPVRLVWGEDYNKALCGAKIALCFLSKLNRDTYTRRCFEIPASGVFLLSSHSPDLESMFVAGEEAEYFHSVEGMIDKIRVYLDDDQRRRNVASAGRTKVVAAGHDVRSRMSSLLQMVHEINKVSGNAQLN
ncbi:MAG: hypothetical protein EXR84_14430 [Gammaproteobacteria bacterium]|nr:hypothetical protein [Gammaproteobacteria bacterium]